MNRIPKLYETENTLIQDKVIHSHFIIGNADWYICEYDGDDLFGGFANLGDLSTAEWGYINFNELNSIKVTGWLEVDFNLCWEPKPALDVEIIKRAMAQRGKCHV